MGNPLVIWCNVPFGAANASRRQRLIDGVAAAGHTLHVVDDTTASDQSKAWLAEADVVFGYPPVEPLIASDNVRWVELGSAGYEKFDRPDLRANLTKHNAP